MPLVFTQKSLLNQRAKFENGTFSSHCTSRPSNVRSHCRVRTRSRFVGISRYKYPAISRAGAEIHIRSLGEHGSASRGIFSKSTLWAAGRNHSNARLRLRDRIYERVCSGAPVNSNRGAACAPRTHSQCWGSASRAMYTNYSWQLPARTERRSTYGWERSIDIGALSVRFHEAELCCIRDARRLRERRELRSSPCNL